VYLGNYLEISNSYQLSYQYAMRVYTTSQNISRMINQAIWNTVDIWHSFRSI